MSALGSIGIGNSEIVHLYLTVLSVLAQGNFLHTPLRPVNAMK